MIVQTLQAPPKHTHTHDQISLLSLLPPPPRALFQAQERSRRGLNSCETHNAVLSGGLPALCHLTRVRTIITLVVKKERAILPRFLLIFV